MKKISKYLKSLFSPEHMQNIDFTEVLNAFHSETVRKIWIYEFYQELKNLNLSVDRSLLHGDARINDLSARRKAFQDILEMVLSAKRQAIEEKDPAPKIMSEVDLDRRTV